MVNKCPICGAPMEDNKCGYCGYQEKTTEQSNNIGYGMPYNNGMPQYKQICSPKSKWSAFLLDLFLGYFGAHQFYVGKVAMGILYLFTAGLFGIGWFVDLILIATGSFKDKNGLRLTR